MQIFDLKLKNFISPQSILSLKIFLNGKFAKNKYKLKNSLENYQIFSKVLQE